MKVVIQRVTSATVSSKNIILGSIKNGLVILVAIHRNDTEVSITKMAKKIINLRIFEDKNGKINQSIIDVGGELLLISQFTLYGDCTKGNRPSFIEAAEPEKAQNYYEKLITALKNKNLRVETGKFRSYMQVSLVNDGPTTLIIEV